MKKNKWVGLGWPSIWNDCEWTSYVVIIHSFGSKLIHVVQYRGENLNAFWAAFKHYRQNEGFLVQI
jgi:hypothetical protein